MKFLHAAVVTLVLAAPAFSQSKAWSTLKHRFAGHEGVISFSTPGFLARVVLAAAGEHTFNEAIRDVRHIGIMVIPADAFRKEKVSLAGFEKFARRESFEALLRVRDSGDNVTILLQEAKKQKDNRYLLLVDSDDEIVVMELKGYLDPQILREHDNKMAYHEQD